MVFGSRPGSGESQRLHLVVAVLAAGYSWRLLHLWPLAQGWLMEVQRNASAFYSPPKHKGTNCYGPLSSLMHFGYLCHSGLHPTSSANRVPQVTTALVMFEIGGSRSLPTKALSQRRDGRKIRRNPPSSRSHDVRDFYPSVTACVRPASSSTRCTPAEMSRQFNLAETIPSGSCGGSPPWTCCRRRALPRILNKRLRAILCGRSSGSNTTASRPSCQRVR